MPVVLSSLAKTMQATPPHPLSHDGALVFGEQSLHPQQQPILGCVFQIRLIDELKHYPPTLELIQQQTLMHILPG